TLPRCGLPAAGGRGSRLGGAIAVADSHRLVAALDLPNHRKGEVPGGQLAKVSHLRGGSAFVGVPGERIAGAVRRTGLGGGGGSGGPAERHDQREQGRGEEQEAHGVLLSPALIPPRPRVAQRLAGGGGSGYRLRPWGRISTATSSSSGRGITALPALIISPPGA